MLRNRSVLGSVAAVALGVALLGVAPHDAAAAGTFRFLTRSIPIGSTNAEYVARLLTANASGAVTFDLAPGSVLVNGMVLDGRTGLITGRPTVTTNSSVTFRATDGVATISLTTQLRVNSSGGGGNEGATFTNVVLPEARVGTAYSHTIGMVNGVGPYVFGAAALPPGLSMNGLTGEVSGTPRAPGTWFVSLSISDLGESNRAVTVQPLTVLPAASDFRFTSFVVDNGEVGTTYEDLWTTTGAAGAVSYSASGLPPGVAVTPTSGVVTGVPTQAGTFTALLSATDGADTLTTNLSFIIAPSPASQLYWDFSGLPAALIGVAYNRQPPIVVSAQNGATMTYEAFGLPPGIVYSATTGELTGTPTEMGEYPVTFVATDTTALQAISLAIDFLVLPPSGGDANGLSVNLWSTKHMLRPGAPGRGLWSGTCIYNSDRRPGAVFDAAVDPVVLSAGSRTIQLPAGAMTGDAALCSYRSARGEVPAVQLRVSAAKQTVQWKSASDTLTDTLPTVARLTVSLGRRGYRLDEDLDAAGLFHAPSGFRRTAFVVAKGKLGVVGEGKDSATLSLLLADPAFAYTPGVSLLRVRLLDGVTPLVDRDFTALGTSTIGTDRRTGLATTTLRTVVDEAVAARVAKFLYSTGTGKMTVSLTGLSLGALLDPAEHLGVEITIGTRVYFTAVTLFAPRAGQYSTKM